MATVTRRIWRKTSLTREGGSVSGCFTWTPLGDTWTSSTSLQGGEVTLSQVLPNWRYRISRGMSATTSFIANDIAIDFVPGFCDSRRLCNVLVNGKWVQRWGRETLSGYLNDGFSDVQLPSAASTSIDPIVDAQARADFIKRARRSQGALRGATVLAELADTLRTIRNPARALRSSVDEYSAVARRRIRKAIGRDPRGVRARDLSKRQSRAAQRALSDSWLEAQFGWLPLIGDIEDGYKAARRLNNRVETDRVSAESNYRDNPVITGHSSQSRNLSFTTHVYTWQEKQVRYYGAVKVNVSTPASSAIEEAGLRVRDFVPALWEWIPYSFLVDYFTNIGDIVEAASFPRSDLAWAARTFRNTVVRDGSRMTYQKLSSLPPGATNHIEVFAVHPSTIVIRRKYVSRDPFSGSFVPSLRFEIPGVRDWKKFLNIGALAHLRGMRR